MNNEQIAQLLEKELPGCQVKVESDGNHFQVTAIGDHFEGLSKVKRQQEVYRCLNDLLSSGTIHAVRMQLYTNEEYAKLAD